MLTEKEKMCSSKPFKAFEKKLSEERANAKELLFEFNTAKPKAFSKKNELLKKLVGKAPKSFYIEPPLYCDYGYNIEIGNKFYANTNLTILDCAKVVIGNHVFIGPNVGIYAVSHPIHYEHRNKYFEIAHPITIGDNVWIGGSVVINPGITIGNNSVIGSGSVVTKNIPENVVAAGNPCKVIREITEMDKMEFKPD
ncbi:MAG: sugar O-acetyltransferase [Balneolaceae bacterium]